MRHLLRRALASLDCESHRQCVALEAQDIVEHLRCTRDAYRDFVNRQKCQPVLEAYWVILRYAVFPTAIEILRDKVVDYLTQTQVPARDLALLFGIPGHT